MRLLGSRNALIPPSYSWMISPGDASPALVELRHAGEDAPVLFQREVFPLQHARHLDEQRIVHHDRAEHEPLGIQVDGEPFIQCEIDGCHGTLPY
jgi:hypothetical protein